MKANNVLLQPAFLSLPKLSFKFLVAYHPWCYHLYDPGKAFLFTIIRIVCLLARLSQLVHILASNRTYCSYLYELGIFRYNKYDFSKMLNQKYRLKFIGFIIECWPEYLNQQLFLSLPFNPSWLRTNKFLYPAESLSFFYLYCRSAIKRFAENIAFFPIIILFIIKRFCWRISAIETRVDKNWQLVQFVCVQLQANTNN